MTVFIHPLAVVEDGVSVGDGSRIWHWAHVRTGAKIGEQCIVGKSVYIDQGVVIGRRVKIQNNVSIYHGVEVQDGVFIGPHVCFTNDLFPRAITPTGDLQNESDWRASITIIKYGASIGANSTIVAGITLGEWCMVGAGSLVTRDVPPHALVYGSPARIRGVVASDGEIVSRKYAPGIYKSTRGQTVELRENWESNHGFERSREPVCRTSKCNASTEQGDPT